MRPVAACGTWWLWWAALEISETVQDYVGFQETKFLLQRASHLYKWFYPFRLTRTLRYDVLTRSKQISINGFCPFIRHCFMRIAPPTVLITVLILYCLH